MDGLSIFLGFGLAAIVLCVGGALYSIGGTVARTEVFAACDRDGFVWYFGTKYVCQPVKKTTP